MTIDLDDEILQDFLVEAGEILEQLGEQLVRLELTPEDPELLNAIFRGFHTIKGGAGFLSLDPLVSVCHQAEDVFDVLREGERKITADLMDVILEVVDVVNLMFEQVKVGNDPEHADENLLERLLSFTRGAGEVENADLESTVIIDAPVVADVVEQEFESMLSDGTESATADSADDEITEDEFDNLLDELHGKGKFSVQGLQQQTQQDEKSDTGDITEEEFENLLDELHGKGQFSVNSLDKPELSVPKPVPESPSDEITEEEFDNLLDEMHGKGKFSAKNLTEENASETSQDSGDITEEEFDDLLDEIHGKGTFNSANLNQSTNKEDIKEQAIDHSVESAEPKNKQQTKNVQKKPEPIIQSVQKTSAVNPASKKPVKETFNKSEIKPAKSTTTAPQTETTVRVDTHILDDIMNMVGELVLVRNRFQTLKASSELDSSENMTKAVANLDIVTADLQLAVMKTRMQPIKKVFGRFPRVVRDLSRSLNKEIRLELVGEETDLDKNLVEALADPLVHLVRNAVDHGIESPEDRVAAGKPRAGLVILTASQEGDHIQLSIKDDGKGMNADVLRRMVVEKGLMDEESAARLENKECYNLIFMPGFSTKTEISDVSGRGVGMDVVKTRITQMNGVVEIDSEEGVGSTIIIKVPLTLAIMPTLMVILGGQAFALPLASVLEILDLDLSRTNVVDGQLVIMVREKALPVFFLSEWLVNDPNYVLDKQSTGHVVVVNAGGRQIGFVVDQLIGQEEVVIKPLGAKLQGLEGLAGATITGDGKIALILDVPGLMSKYAG